MLNLSRQRQLAAGDRRLERVQEHADRGVVAEPAAGVTQTVSANVAEAARAASGSKTKANAALESAREMPRQSETLAREVARFLGEIRAA
jgi:hypothetical protein